MKRKHKCRSPKKIKPDRPFLIPSIEWSYEQEIAEIVSNIVTSRTVTRQERLPEQAGAAADKLKAWVSIANNLWRARKRMTDAATGEIREDLKRIHDRVEAIRRSLAEVGMVIHYYPDGSEGGLVIRDHTGEVYDEGQPMKVIASKPTPGLDKKRVSETLLPSIYWNNQLIQNGEIEIAVPSASIP
jgi:hypothetical protein